MKAGIVEKAVNAGQIVLASGGVDRAVAPRMRQQVAQPHRFQLVAPDAVGVGPRCARVVRRQPGHLHAQPAQAGGNRQRGRAGANDKGIVGHSRLGSVQWDMRFFFHMADEYNQPGPCVL